MLVGVFLIWALFRLIFRRKKYIDSCGYVVLAKFKELEHRHIAKQLLKRHLAHNEVVHHINGKKKKSGKYPTIRTRFQL